MPAILIRFTPILVSSSTEERLEIPTTFKGSCAVSRRNFDRRFIKAIGITPVEYMQRVKIEAAKSLLERGRKSVFEIMYEVGYSDERAFRDVFKKKTGLSPTDYKLRFNKESSFF